MLHLVHILEATTGGTRRHLRDLALGLDPEAFRVDVIVSLRRDPDAARDLALFRERGIGVHVVPMRRRIAPLADAVALLRLVRLLRRLRPDIVHAHSSKAGFLGRLAARVAGVRAIVYTPHAFSFEDAGAPLRTRCYRLLERLAIPWTARLIAVSSRDAEEARQLGFPAARVDRIPNGIREAEKGARTEAPASRKPEGGVPTVLFLGRLCRQKGPDLLLAAIPEILRHVPEARFRIVGEGPWRDWAVRLAARESWGDRVSFGHARDEADVAQEFAAATLLVLPSRWEGLPYTLLEALQAGVPVVAADVGGVRDVAVGLPGERAAGCGGEPACALLLPPHDPAALATGVSGLLRSPDMRARLAAAGRERVQAFGLARMIGQTAVVYQTVVAGSGEGPAPQGSE